VYIRIFVDLKKTSSKKKLCCGKNIKYNITYLALKYEKPFFAFPLLLIKNLENLYLPQRIL